MFAAEQKNIEAKIARYCSDQDIPLAPLQWVPVPFSGEWGISTSFFQTAANEARAGKKVVVPQRAQEIAELVKAQIGSLEGISHIEAVKGYLNLYYSTSGYARRVVDIVLQSGEDFGRGDPKAERVMVEYSQPNTHHSFHIGHYRNTILGEALARIVEYSGFDTVRASYPGDIGLGVITVLWIYHKFYRGQEPEGIHERGQWLLKLYVEATRMLEEKAGESLEEKALREEYDRERREMLRKWDAGDPEIRQLWLETREWSLEELRAILAILDTHMDVWFYESEANELGKAIVEELIEKDIAEDERASGGPVIVKIDEKLGLSKDRYRTAVILRSDGTALYITNDLALARQKFEKYHVDRSIYVVDVRQSLHFQQVFKILELWGFPQAEKCFHLGYGFVTLPEGAMSARRGRVVLFKEVADEAVRRVLSEIAQKNPDLPAEQREEVARIVGLGSLAYAMLAVDNNKDIVFEMDSALNFDGRTGPYIQNAHVRAASILKKARVQFPELRFLDGSDQAFQQTFEYELSGHEVQLIDLISRFPTVVQQAANEYRPLVMATYAYELATAFHSFYHAVPVLQAETEAVRVSRLRLVATARQAIANALRLLVIKAPDMM